jgi:hypothetical protein
MRRLSDSPTRVAGNRNDLFLEGEPSSLEIILTLEMALTASMRDLRVGSYDGHHCDRDPFDAYSCHLTAWYQRQPVGMVRLTRGPRFALVAWSKGTFIPPADADLEMTRGVVHQDYRRIGLYKLLMIQSLLCSSRMQLHRAIAAVEPDFPGKPFLHSLGFIDHGSPLRFDNFFAQPIECRIDPVREQLWLKMFWEQSASMSTHGVQVSVRGFHLTAWPEGIAAFRLS